MRALRGIKKAALAFHRWFMKYSGNTMIIDNIEERRRGRLSEERSEVDSGTSCEGDSLQRQHSIAIPCRLVGKEPTADSGDAVVEPVEENKKVLG
jgi:hypothetical protein